MASGVSILVSVCLLPINCQSKDLCSFLPKSFLNYELLQDVSNICSQLGTVWLGRNASDRGVGEMVVHLVTREKENWASIILPLVSTVALDF